LFLLDTNVIYWLGTTPNKISGEIKDAITHQDCVCYVSVMSAWEYGQKRKLKPKQLPIAFDILVSMMPHEKLSFAYEVFQYAESLPLIHRDPFDRMLVAQALHHDLTLITADKEIAKYPVKTLW
jgi:PIN domain nuclease of toxin-antitoxin system